MDNDNQNYDNKIIRPAKEKTDYDNPLHDEPVSHPRIVTVPHKSPLSVTKTSETAYEIIEEIKKLDLITPEEMARFKDAQVFALESFRDVPSYRPMIVKLTSVLNDGQFPTTDMKFWQCKKEAEVHFNELTRDYFKYERSKVDIDELAYKIQEIDEMTSSGGTTGKYGQTMTYDPHLIGFDRKRLILKKAQYEFELKLLEKDIKYRLQEVIDWSFISKNLEAKCEFSTTNYQEHTIKGHIKYIQQRLKNPDLKPEEQKLLKSQLDTFNRLNKFS